MTIQQEVHDVNDSKASVVALRPMSQIAPVSEDDKLAYLEEKMLATLDRAIAVVSDETRALRSDVIVDLKPYSDAKSRALLDLNRVMGESSFKEKPVSVVNQLRLFRQVLDDNEKLLFTHLEAVREITELLSATLIKAESDGTYTSSSLEAK
ncbi:hypothetical protein [uncultured Cohaesibacter sp.]|uniref:hypothetical protein n=1 Tax=uncultured Cohaesibacter sp. TaxID=1002546 RepID=UPI0029C67CFF|nr:hypothetical protein [uncultured Cohaesibacter sp.]